MIELDLCGTAASEMAHIVPSSPRSPDCCATSSAYAVATTSTPTHRCTLSRDTSKEHRLTRNNLNIVGDDKDSNDHGGQSDMPLTLPTNVADRTPIEEFSLPRCSFMRWTRYEYFSTQLGMLCSLAMIGCVLARTWHTYQSSRPVCTDTDHIHPRKNMFHKGDDDLSCVANGYDLVCEDGSNGVEKGSAVCSSSSSSTVATSHVLPAVPPLYTAETSVYTHHGLPAGAYGWCRVHGLLKTSPYSIKIDQRSNPTVHGSNSDSDTIGMNGERDSNCCTDKNSEKLCMPGVVNGNSLRGAALSFALRWVVPASIQSRILATLSRGQTRAKSSRIDCLDHNGYSLSSATTALQKDMTHFVSCTPSDPMPTCVLGGVHSLHEIHDHNSARTTSSPNFGRPKSIPATTRSDTRPSAIFIDTPHAYGNDENVDGCCSSCLSSSSSSCRSPSGELDDSSSNDDSETYVREYGHDSQERGVCRGGDGSATHCVGEQTGKAVCSKRTDAPMAACIERSNHHHHHRASLNIHSYRSSCVCSAEATQANCRVDDTQSNGGDNECSNNDKELGCPRSSGSFCSSCSSYESADCRRSSSWITRTTSSFSTSLSSSFDSQSATTDAHSSDSTWSYVSHECSSLCEKTTDVDKAACSRCTCHADSVTRVIAALPHDRHTSQQGKQTIQQVHGPASRTRGRRGRGSGVDDLAFATSTQYTAPPCLSATPARWFDALAQRDARSECTMYMANNYHSSTRNSDTCNSKKTDTRLDDTTARLPNELTCCTPTTSHTPLLAQTMDSATRADGCTIAARWAALQRRRRLQQVHTHALRHSQRGGTTTLSCPFLMRKEAEEQRLHPQQLHELQQQQRCSESDAQSELTCRWIKWAGAGWNMRRMMAHTTPVMRVGRGSSYTPHPKNATESILHTAAREGCRKQTNRQAAAAAAATMARIPCGVGSGFWCWDAEKDKPASKSTPGRHAVAAAKQERDEREEVQERMDCVGDKCRRATGSDAAPTTTRHTEQETRARCRGQSLYTPAGAVRSYRTSDDTSKSHICTKSTHEGGPDVVNMLRSSSLSPPCFSPLSDSCSFGAMSRTPVGAKDSASVSVRLHTVDAYPTTTAARTATARAESAACNNEATSTSQPQDDDAKSETPRTARSIAEKESMWAGVAWSAALPMCEPRRDRVLRGVAGRCGEMQIGAFLGGGACGKVYECLNMETGAVYAVKQICLDKDDPTLRQRLRQLRLELEVLTLAARCKSRWVVGYHGAERHGHSVLMYLEYCEHGSLLDYLVTRTTVRYQESDPHDTTRVTTIHATRYSINNDNHKDAGDSLLGHSNSWTKHRYTEDGDNSVCSSRVTDWGVHCTSTPNRTLHKRNENEPQHEQQPHESEENDNEKEAGVDTVDAETDTLSALSLSQVQDFTRQITEGLYFLHSHNYAHLDIKTANVLLTSRGECRLADLGCAMRLRSPTRSDVAYGNTEVSQSSSSSSVSSVYPCATSTSVGEEEAAEATFKQTEEDAVSTKMQLDKTKATTNKALIVPTAQVTRAPGCSSPPRYRTLQSYDHFTELRGTAMYMAPEMIRFERARIGSAADIWSLGCVVMELVTGSSPWRHLAGDKMCILLHVGNARCSLPLPPMMQRRICAARQMCATATSVTAQRWARRYDALGDFVERCLCLDPNARSTASELLQHPFLTL